MTIKNKPKTRFCKEFCHKYKKISYGICFLFLFACNSVKSQVFENFDDNDLLANPTWFGDVAKFQTIDGHLVSNSKIASDRFYLATSNRRYQQTQWEFTLKLAFNTSSVNYVDVFLISDSARLIGLNSGYFLRIGGTEDEISLYKKTGVSIIEILDGRNGRTDNSSNLFSIKVIYDSLKVFNIWIDSTGNRNSYNLQGTTKEIINSECAYFGFLMRQSTSGFFQKHTLDDLYIGPVLFDTIPPKLYGLEVLAMDMLKLVFSEKIYLPELLNSFEINQSVGNPISFQTDNRDSLKCSIALDKPLEPYKQYSLYLKNINDRFGNVLKDTQLDFRWIPVFEPEPYDLLITEWLPDPDPAILMPDDEYIEIMNHSNRALQLLNCRMDDGSTIGYLPSIVLEKDSFLILCRAGAETKFARFGKVLGLKSFPSLNNSEDILTLRNSKGDLLHRVIYDLNSYQDVFKSQGGWSIEMIDPRNPCSKLNYKASQNSSGGTPGSLNSVWGNYLDKSKPEIINVKVKMASQIFVEFNEILDSAEAVQLNNLVTSELNLSEMSLNLNILEIKLSTPPVIGKLYTLGVKNISDCVSNRMKDTVVLFALPEVALKGDILITEILFNPPSGGVDFIEIYNASNKILTLKDLSIFNFSELQKPENVIYLDTSGELLFPHSYKVLCTNPVWVKSHYFKHNPAAFLKLGSWVRMDDDKGHIGISTRSGEIMDELKYREQMHWPLLTDKEGVSLERISLETNVDMGLNFTSAAATFGFATPGLPNSHLHQLMDNKKWVQIEPDLFSPNEDGLDDLLGIRLDTDCSDCQAFIRIFDTNGQLVHELVNNVPIGNSQTWFWDGITDKGKKADIGIYIVFVEMYGINQKRKTFKQTITVGG